MAEPTKLRVADVVYYGMDSFDQHRQSWRITHHLKRIEDTFRKTKPESAVDIIINRVIAKEIARDKRRRKRNGLPCKRRFRYQYCTQAEATHVELVAVCGAIAPVEECEFIEQVKWPKRLIKESQESAVTDYILGRLTDWQWE